MSILIGFGGFEKADRRELLLIQNVKNAQAILTVQDGKEFPFAGNRKKKELCNCLCVEQLEEEEKENCNIPADRFYVKDNCKLNFLNYRIRYFSN